MNSSKIWFCAVTAAATLVACGPGTENTTDPSATGTNPTNATSETTVGPTTNVSTTTNPTTPPSTSDDSCNYSTCTSVSDSDDSTSTTGPCLPPDCTPAQCDPFMQDCDPGLKCTYYGAMSWDSLGCLPVDGPGMDGDACVVDGIPTSGVDDCAAGFMCWDADAGGNGSCVPLCGGSFEDLTCPDGKVVVTGQTGPCLCFDVCDPLGNDCDDGQLCIPNSLGDGFLCALDASGDAHPTGSTCEFVNQCNMGLFCLNADFFNHPDCDGLGCCSPYCDLNQGMGNQNPVCMALEGDVPGVECEPYYEMGMAPMGQEHIGVCAAVP